MSGEQRLTDVARLLGIPLTWETVRDHGADKVSARLELDPRWPVFAEHFPGDPMLPGSAVVHLMAQLARELDRGAQRGDVPARTLRDVRFARPLVPPGRVTFTAERRADGGVRCEAVLEPEPEPAQRETEGGTVAAEGGTVAARGVFAADGT
nr:hypothetical protein StreXyl84_70830 [Streptomyces sp. Xyl84]